MAINVGSATATLNLDISQYQKGIASAAEQYKVLMQLHLDYEKQVRGVNERLANDEKKLTDAYDKAFAARQASLVNFVGIFDKVSGKGVSGTQLLDNLKGQLDAMKLYAESLESLKNKGIDESLYKHLSGLGAGSYVEVAALNALTEEQLEQYQEIYREKNRLAQAQAEEQMAGQRQILAEDLASLRQEAATQLNYLTEAYDEKIRAAREKTKAELAEMTASWLAAMTGIDGVLSDEMTAQEFIVAAAALLKGGYLRQEEATQKKIEADKTENVKRENKRQENDVRLSQNNNIDTLRQFVSTWRSIGVEYGENLLAGIRSTRTGIVSYLQEVAAAVRAAQGGGSVSISAYAAGTPSAAKGLAVVGERGPEIVDFSGGEQVMSFQNSLQLLGEGVSALGRSLAAVSAYESEPYLGAAQTGVDYERLAKTVAEMIPQQPPTINYSPVYNSPKAASISELRQQDKVNMRRLGLSN